MVVIELPDSSTLEFNAPVTAGAVASSVIARVSVLLVRLGGPNRPKTECPGAAAANQASGTKG